MGGTYRWKKLIFIKISDIDGTNNNDDANNSKHHRKELTVHHKVGINNANNNRTVRVALLIKNFPLSN